MTHRSFGYVLLAVALTLVGVGVWRGYVRWFGSPDQHWLIQAFSPAGGPLTLDDIQREFAEALAAEDDARAEQVKARLEAQIERRQFRDRWLGWSRRVETLFCIGGVAGGVWVGRRACRRLWPSRAEIARPSGEAERPG